MRQTRGEVIIVGDENQPVSERAQPPHQRGELYSCVVVLAERRLVQHDPGLGAGEGPEPAQAFARSERELIEVRIERTHPEMLRQRAQPLVGRNLKSAAGERHSPA